MDYDNSKSETSKSLSHNSKFKSESLSIKEKDIEQLPDDTHISLDTSLNNSQNLDEENINQLLQQLPDPPSSNNKTNKSIPNHPACQFRADKQWLDCQYHDLEHTSIKKPDEIENDMEDPPNDYDNEILDRIQGSIIGIALGDALGAHVEFRPRDYLREHPVEDLKGGGTWGLNIGQFTDDTSMALCLANSLVARRDFIPYDQLVRYKWWHINGYMSSTGQCFDIGSATSDSLREFARRQNIFATENHIPVQELDFLSDENLLDKFNVFCSEEGVAGNGALMRLAPVPLFFYKNPVEAVKYSGISGKITHGDQKAYDACRYYGALIVAALCGETKEQLLDKDFYVKHKDWFSDIALHSDIMEISQGSYQKERGYDEGIRGKGYIVNALEAALWAFWSDENSFKTGVLAAVNLGDDTDTTAAIYGQLAGAYYGYKDLPSEWTEKVYAKKFIATLSKWIAYEGQRWQPKKIPPSTTSLTLQPQYDTNTMPSSPQKSTIHSQSIHTHNEVFNFSSTQFDETLKNEPSHKFESHKYNQIHHTISTNKQPAPTSKTIELRDDIRTLNKGESAVVGTYFPRESTSNGPSTNKPFNLNKNLLLWTDNDVCQWIQSFGENYLIYVDSFKKDRTDGYRLYNFINNKTLIEFGVKNETHRQNILNAIGQLRKDCLSKR